MLDDLEDRLFEPLTWPLDPEAREALQEYVNLINDEKEGPESELGGFLDFHGADLRKFQLQWQFLWGSDFSGVRLDRADLYKAELVEALLHGASLQGANLHKADISACEAQRASFAGANLLNTDLSESDLREADFKEVWAGGTLFFNSDLRGGRFPEGEVRHRKSRSMDRLQWSKNRRRSILRSEGDSPRADRCRREEQKYSGRPRP
ncbi:pentapeptide repeat-containing protein [Nocardiopsis alba]|uniref:pentapeptide repeat-containing protein n=1 Tax=Nocardiopsis alba TaxID=53437 RepID=UPI00340592B9